MKTILLKAFNVKQKELPLLLGGILLFFLLFTAYAMLRPVRETMGIAGGIANLQWLFTVTFIASIVLQAGFGWLVTKVSRRLIMPWVYGFFIANLLLFIASFLLAPNNAWTARLFYVWLSVFNLLAVSLTWSVLNDLIDAEQSRRLFAIVASGSSAGAIVGPILTLSLVKAVGTSGLLSISAIILTVAAIIAVQLHKWRDRYPAENGSGSRAERERALGGNPFAGTVSTFKSPYLMGIAVFVALAASANTFLYFELMRIVSIDYPLRAEQTQLFSVIDLIVNSLTILMQLFVTGRMAQRLGIGSLLMIVPIVTALGFLWLALMPLLTVVVVVMVIRRIGQYALIRPGREMLYGVTTAEDKYKARNFIDTVLYRGGDMASAWLKRSLDLLGGIHSPLAMAGGAILAIGWTGVAYYLARAQAARESNAHSSQAKPEVFGSE